MAMGIAAGVRQKTVLVKKLDERSRMHYLLEAAAARSKVYIRQQMEQGQQMYSQALKTNLHNNPAVFASILVGEDQAQVSFTLYEGALVSERFGVVDEERKINLNKTDVLTLGKLLDRVLGIKTDDAQKLARAILDWRQLGESEAVGFFSDEYYSNLQYPYPKKSAEYEVLDELLLVKGVTKDVYERLLPYVTIYGDGRININTAPAPVLYALGLQDEVVEKILTVRRGKDGIEGTADDWFFSKPFDVPAEVSAFVKLEPTDARSIDALNLQGSISCNSYYFSMNVRAILARSQWSKNAWMVFSPAENKILYWREK